ncbi:MAG: XrtA/PEP-CTERM system TPR-repeat protein PrsT [Chromatocurvus sp.]
MKIKRWVAGFTVAAALAACSSPESPEVLLERAREALAEGKTNAAVIDIKTALQQESDNAQARLLFGRAYLMQNDPASAVDEFRRAADSGLAEAEAEYARSLVAAGRAAELIEFHEQSDPAPAASGDPLYLAALARAYSGRGNAAAAEAALDQAAADGADSAYLRVTHALAALVDSRETEVAAGLLARATSDYPQDAEAWSLRADIARLEGDLESAADFYARAAELSPARLADRLKFVDVALQLGRTEDAEAQLARLEKVIPDHPGVNFARGRMLLESGDYKAGLQELSRVLGSIPQHAGSLYLAGAANAREGNFATAQSQLAQFLEAQPGHVAARLELANVYLQMQEPAAAEDLSRRVLDTDPQNTGAMRLLATALGTQGLFAESAQVYADLAAIEPDALDARVGLGTTRLLSGDSQGGLADLRTALANNPDRSELRERLIASELALGNIEGARADAQAYLEASGDSLRALILAGRVALQSGEGAEARRLFEEVLGRDPHNRDANGGLAALALANSDIATARDHFEDSLQGHPGDPATLMNLAVLAERSGDLDAMEASLLAAIDSNEDALRPRVALARYRTGQGNPEAAIRLLTRVERDNADSFALHHTLATAHLANDSPAFALDSARRALDLQPQQPAALIIAARAEQANGRYADAQAHMEAALALVDDVSVRKLLVENLLQQNKLDVAREQIQMLPDAEREAPATRLLLGRIAMAQEEFAKAEALFQSLFDAQGDSVSLAYLTGAQWALGRQQEVIASLQAWLGENPGDVELRNQLATRYLMAADEEAARSEYLRLLEEAPESPMVLNNLAWLERERNPEEALEYVRRASELAPDSVQIMDTHAMVERERGNYAVALRLSTKALKAAPDAPELRLNRALILVDAGRPAEARALLEELVAGPASPQHEEARALLATL